MIVADAGVLYAALFDQGPAGDSCARRLAKERRILGPALATLEVLQTARRFARSGQLDPEIVPRGTSRLATILETVGHEALARRVWEMRENLTAYDAAYVALAELLDRPLLTGDARLARAAGPRCDIELLAVSSAE